MKQPMGWNHIILEGFCAKDWYTRGNKWTYGWKGNKNPEDRGKKPNPDYDPNYVNPPYPDFCKRRVCYTCYDEDCPHLALGEGRIKDVIKLNKRGKR